MLEPHHKLAIYAENAMGKLDAKMAEGVLRYGENPVLCVIDSRCAGKKVKDVCAVPSEVPIVAGIHDAIEMGTEALVLGTAPSGGRIPADWWDALDQAVAGGVSIVNGLHDKLNEHYTDLPGSTQWIWDIRSPAGDAPRIASGLAGNLDNKRVLMIGTDMAIGKMTAGLEIHRWLREQDVSAAFLASGQVGMTITGRGIPLDALKVDHACGAVERMVMTAADSDVVIVEGQGSLLHPGSSATLPLMRGSCANHFVLCHKAGLEKIQSDDAEIRIPPLREFIALNEAVASACGSLTAARTIGIALNTRELDEQQALRSIAAVEDETGLPVQDVVRFGAQKLASLLM
ncbi:MAG: DUF1611 domain-containing protein [Hyphomicrobiales bacterium]|nr:DUF1611 domain-containing protein [Hyphomicrobiales bacterium]